MYESHKCMSAAKIALIGAQCWNTRCSRYWVNQDWSIPHRAIFPLKWYLHNIQTTPHSDFLFVTLHWFCLRKAHHTLPRFFSEHPQTSCTSKDEVRLRLHCFYPRHNYEKILFHTILSILLSIRFQIHYSCTTLAYHYLDSSWLQSTLWMKHTFISFLSLHFEPRLVHFFYNFNLSKKLEHSSSAHWSIEGSSSTKRHSSLPPPGNRASAPTSSS